MRSALPIMIFVCVATTALSAGDDSSGPIAYSVDLGLAFTTYHMSDRDKQWSASLGRNLKYSGEVLHFLRTSLPLSDATAVATVTGAVYQAFEKPNLFYVVPSDVVLRIGVRWPIGQGAGGFSVHAPKSRNFIVALHCCVGVPVISSSPVIKGKVAWKGRNSSRSDGTHAGA